MTGQFIWWRQFGFEELKKGHLALWDPYLFGGAPYFAGFQSALLYPPNWLFMVLPLPFALNFTIAFHVFLGGWFTFLWIRGRGSRPASALLAAFMFMFGAAFFLHLVPGHLPNLCTMGWMPLVLLAVERYREDREIRWIVLGTLALAFELLAGHVQYVYYTFLFVGLYALAELPRIPKKINFLAGLASMGAGMGFLCAVQLLAGWDAAGESIRSQHLTIDMLDVGDMTPERLWGLLMPDFFGNYQNYWGGGMYWEGAMAVSLTGFVLAIFGLAYSRDRRRLLFAGLGVFFTLIAIGKRGPLFIPFCKYFPLFNDFRGVGKLNILATLSLVALAAMGLDEIWEKPSLLPKLAKTSAMGTVLTGFLALAGWISLEWGGGRLFKKFPSEGSHIIQSLLLCSILFLALAFLSWGARERPWLRYGFLALAFLELFGFALNNMPSFDYRTFMNRVEVISQTYQQDPGDYRVSANNCYAMGLGGFDVWGEDPVVPYRYAVFASAAQNYGSYIDIFGKAFLKEPPPALGLLRLRYIFTEGPNGLVVHWTGLKETPRFFVTGQWKVLKPDEITARSIQPGFDATREALLESNPGISPGAGKLESQVKVEDLTTDEIHIDARVSQPSVLVLADNYSHGWKAAPVGPSAQAAYSVMPAYGFLRGIPLEAGEHHLLLEYQPTAFVIGKWISIFAWLALAFLFSGKEKSFSGKNLKPGENPAGENRFFQSPWAIPGILLAATLAVFWNFLSPSTSQVLSIPGGDLSDILIWWYQFWFRGSSKRAIWAA